MVKAYVALLKNGHLPSKKYVPECGGTLGLLQVIKIKLQLIRGSGKCPTYGHRNIWKMFRKIE